MVEEKEEFKVSWDLRNRIEKIIDKNCKDIPYEGWDIDKSSMAEDFIGLLKELHEKKDVATDKH